LRVAQGFKAEPLGQLWRTHLPRRR
jgi:hypothetical protein